MCHHLLLSSSVTCYLFAVVSEIAIVAEIEGGGEGQMTTDRQAGSPYKMTAAKQGQTGRDIYTGCLGVDVVIVLYNNNEEL